MLERVAGEWERSEGRSGVAPDLTNFDRKLGGIVEGGDGDNKQLGQC